MGCCGGDQKSSVLIGGILGIIQSIIGIVMASVNIQNFNDNSNTLTQVVWDTKSYVKGFLIVFLLLQLAWLVSSAVLIFANTRNNVCGIRQWLVTTSLVIICEFVLPGIVVAITAYQLYKGTVDMTVRAVGSSSSYYYYNSYSITFIPGFLGSYISLIFTFSKGGLVTVITNIVFCVFTGKRINEIVSPSTGFVIGQAAVTPLQSVPPHYAGQTVMQPNYSLQQPHAYQQILVQGQTLQPVQLQGHAFQQLQVQGQPFQATHIQSQNQPLGNFQGPVHQPIQSQVQQQFDFQRSVTQPSGSTDDFVDRPPQFTTADHFEEYRKQG